MKRFIRIAVATLLFISITLPPKRTEAALPAIVVEAIKKGITKIIKAVDLQIQRMQNKTIWLQNAQKVIENAMSKLKLAEIADWTERQRAQYQQYFDELWKIKTAISYYKRIKEITEKQVRLVKEYERAWGMVRADKHFTVDEISYMGKVYSGILNESIKNVDQLLLVINAFKTQMSDQKRLEIINAAGDKVDENYDDLLRFNKQNALLSLSRAKTDYDVIMVRRLYGIE